jgi:hypothetical protein
MRQIRAILFVAASTTLTLAPLNLKATTINDNEGDDNGDDDDDAPALSMDRVFEKDDGDGNVVTKEKRTQANEHSENAEVKIKRSFDHEVSKDDNESDDDPALDMEGSIETLNKDTELDTTSADQSFSAKSKQAQGFTADLILPNADPSAPER